MLVTSMGVIYKFSKRAWIKYCRAMVNEENVDPEDCGAKYLGFIDAYITDWGTAEYEAALKEAKG